MIIGYIIVVTSIVFILGGLRALFVEGEMVGLIMIAIPIAFFVGIFQSNKKDEQQKAEIQARVRDKMKKEKEEYSKSNDASKPKQSKYSSNYSRSSGSGVMDPIEYQMINDVSSMVGGDSWDDDFF